MGTEVLSYRPLSYEKGCTLGCRINSPPLQIVNLSKFIQPLSPSYSYLDSPSPFIEFPNLFGDELCFSQKYVTNRVTVITNSIVLDKICTSLAI